MEIEFRNYNFANDEKWLSIQRNIEIPAGRNAEEVLLKRKRKYYKDNINSSYTPPVEPEVTKIPTTSASTSTSATASQQSTTSTTSTTSSNYQYKNSNSYSSYGAGYGYNRPIVFGKDPYGTRNTTNPSDFHSFPRYLPQNANFMQKYGIPYFSISIVMLSIICPLVWVLIDKFGYGYCDMIYNYVLYMYIVLNAFKIITRVGMPKFNLQYLSLILTSEDGLLFISSLTYLMAPSSFIVLLPIFINTFFPLIGLTLPFFPPSLLSNPNFRQLPSCPAQVYSLVARTELALYLSQLYYIFTPNRSILFIILIIQYLPMRYVTSAYMRDAIARLTVYVDKVFYHNFMPSLVSHYYTKFKEFAWKKVDLDEIQKNQANASTSGCSIM